MISVRLSCAFVCTGAKSTVVRPNERITDGLPIPERLIPAARVLSADTRPDSVTLWRP